MWMLAVGLTVAIAAETFGGRTFYFGDLHAHTGISPDGSASDMPNGCDDLTACGAIADVFQTATDNGLDFVAFTDHSTSARMDFNPFLQRIWDEKASYSPLIVIPAAERVLRFADGRDVGHKTNLLFQDDDTLLESLSVLTFRGATKTFDSCRQVWGHPARMTVDFGPTLEFAHHPAAGNIMATDWTCHDQTYQPVVEVFSGWGNSLDPSSDYDRLQDPIEGTFVHDALEMHDLKVGFVGGTDNHDTRPGAVCAIDSSDVGTHVYGGGLTVVALPEDESLARSSIYGELVARRSLVTTGPPMPVLVEWITTDGTHTIGEQLYVDDTESTTLWVKVPEGWEGYVDAVRAIGWEDSFDLAEGSAGEWSVSIANDALPKWLYAEVEIDGGLFYGVGVCDDGGTDDREFVWSSPTWFARDADGDGSYSDVDCDDTNDRIYPGRKDIAGNGIDEDCNGRDRPLP